MTLTLKQLKTRRLKGIAYGYAAAWIQLGLDDKTPAYLGEAEEMTPADARTVTQIMERIALDLRNKAHDYESGGE